MEIGDRARELHAHGTRELHVVYAGPAALAFLIGRQLHAVGRVAVYYRGWRGGLVRSYTVRT